MEQWARFASAELQRYAKQKVTLEVRAQRYAQEPGGKERDDDEIAAQRRFCASVHDVLVSLDDEHRVTIGATYLATRSIEQELALDERVDLQQWLWPANAKAKTALDETDYLGARIALALLTPTVLAGAAGLPWLVMWCREKVRDKQKKRDRIKAAVLGESHDRKMAALRAFALARGFEIADAEPEAKPERAREPRAPRFKMPGWAREIREAIG